MFLLVARRRVIIMITTEADNDNTLSVLILNLMTSCRYMSKTD